MYRHPWTGLLSRNLLHVRVREMVVPGGRAAQMRANKASPNSESLWITPSHYLSIIWPQASIFINEDLPDGVHLENRSKESLPFETKEAVGQKE